MKETPFNNRQRFTHNPLRFVLEIIKCIKLLTTNFDATITALPKDRLTVIRGRGDTFFADEIAAAYLRSKNVDLVELEIGHNWSQTLEQHL